MILIGMILLTMAIYYIYEKRCNCDIHIENTLCYNCGYEIKEDFHYCPQCKESLKKKCSGCGKTINIQWRHCPYCDKIDI
ncbi:zinc ribbon domain-containing protein [Geosporobacter ferrireducens]|uniref:DZANK-type domain-containing protein n=1 Tax=Geosporobacter ferrireducens TaxID=1424294 RepID=A0A1D8GE04_9FIRM|nr:hypothetical protein Gferi_05940 [Geosporobacter ferrireducens]MTI56818.1 zinc ribbon domain-containing protein [Geosporobacter ferrireducens]